MKMNIKKSMLTCLLMLGIIPASAQQSEAQTEYVFNPHWYLQVQGGGQYTLGEVSFGDLFSPNVQAAVGYQFDEVLGVRLGVNAWQSKGGSDYEVLNKKFKWAWKYVAPTVDITANLSSLAYGYNPKRLLNLSIFGGIGANIGFSNDEAKDVQAEIASINTPLVVSGQTLNTPLSLLWDGTKTRFVGHFGLLADFRISDNVSFNVELQANTLSDNYNSKPAKNADWYFNGLVGLKFNLGKTYAVWTPGMSLPRGGIFNRKPRIVEKVVEKEVFKDRIIRDTIYLDKIVEVEKKLQPLRRDLFFTINSTTITPTEKQKLDEVAAYLILYPETKVTVTGYADKGTGNAQINERLGKNRAKTVTDKLVNQYKIDRSRIISDSKGDTVQPFPENDQNRVSICIAE